MATHLSSYDGDIAILGGFKPAGTKPLMEAKDILVGNGNKRLDEVLGSGEGSIQSQINSAISSSLNSYYDKTQVDSADALKVDKTAITTSAPASTNTDTQIPSTKSVYTAIEAAKTVAAGNKTDAVTSGSAVPVTSGGVYSKLQDYYTKEEADKAFYVAITITANTLSKAIFEQGDTVKTATFSWATNTLAVSAKVSVNNGTAVETISDGDRANSGKYTVTIDTDTVGANSVAKTVRVDLEVHDAFYNPSTGAGHATKSVNATVCNNIILGGAPRYTGSNLAAVMGDANMSVKKLQGTRTISSAVSVTVNSNKMLTIAIPTGYGSPSNNVFKISNQDTQLTKKASAVKYNNQYGKEVTYDIYQLNPANDDTDLLAKNTTYTVAIS